MTKDTDYFKSFCKISKAFGTAATREELLNLIVDNAITSMDGMAACLFLADERQKIFLPMAQAGLSDNYLHANPLTSGRIISALNTDGYLSSSDVLNDPLLENHEAKKKEGIASLLTVPVKVKNRLIGILTLYSAKQREFAAGEIEFLCALADQGGIAIENNRLHRRMHKNAMLFLDLSCSINSSLDIHQVLNNMTVEICNKLGMKAAVIRLLKDDALEQVASHGLSKTFLDKTRTTTTETAKRALQGETLIITDGSTDNRVTLKSAMEQEGIVSMIVTPIAVREEVIGVMRLYSDVQRQFPDDLVLFVKALAQQGGLAIQNASMFLQLENDKKSLEEDIWSFRSWF